MNYAIDAGDRLIAVSDGWTDFAHRNGDNLLGPDEILSRSLWEFVSGPAVRELYRVILERVRQGAVVSFDFRCDAPEARRELRMDIVPLSNGGISFHTEVVRVTFRPRVELLDRHAPRSPHEVRMCSWCKRLFVPPDAWHEVEDALGRLHIFEGGAMPRLCHDVCGECSEKVVRSACA